MLVHDVVRLAEFTPTDTARLLLDRGADVHVADGESRWTPLHRALYGTARGKLAVALLLLEHGAALDWMRWVKTAFDPQGILNPGKLIPPES